MDLTSPTQIKELLEKYHRKPSKGLGQNFLVHAPTLQKIVEAAEITSQDVALEIGPGLGTLTEALAKKAKRVVAIEKDLAMISILQDTLKDYKNIEVIQADILKSNIHNLTSGHYKLVANLPYYITSPIIRMFLEAQHPPQALVLMVQKEVAQRICAKPPNMSILAVSVQLYATPKIISSVSKECFWPKPNVDSAIIKIIPHHAKPSVAPELFFHIVKAGFAHPRKQLANNFSKIFKQEREFITLWLTKNSLNPLQRAETLSVQDWINLAKSVPF